MTKSIGASRNQIYIAFEKAQDLIDEEKGMTALERNVRRDCIQEKVQKYIFDFLQDDENEVTRFDSNQSFVKVKHPTTGKDIEIHRRVWLVLNKIKQYEQFLASEHYASFQKDCNNATAGLTVWREALKVVGKFVSNPTPLSCVDEKLSGLLHFMRALSTVIRRPAVKAELEKFTDGDGLIYDGLIKVLRQASYHDMVGAVICEKVDFPELHIDKSRACPKLPQFKCTHGTGEIDETGHGPDKCSSCGIEKKLRILEKLLTLPVARDLVKVMVWKKGIRQGTDKHGNPNTQQEILPEQMSVSELVNRFKKQLGICIPHCQEILWMRLIMDTDRARLQQDELIILTDFAAVMDLRAAEAKNSSVDSHAVNDNFVCLHRPRTVRVKGKEKNENGDEVETSEDIKIFETNVHHFFAETYSKGKKTDHPMHNICLDAIVKHYRQIIPGLKRIILYSDNAPAQYRCRQNFIKVASFEERHPGIALVHRLAVSCNFKGPHDAVGKEPAQLAKREELTENRSSSAYEVFELCINKLEKTKNDTPWKGYEEQCNIRLKRKGVYGMDTRRVWFVTETEEKRQELLTKHPGRILLCDRSFILDSQTIKGTNHLHEIRSIATNVPTTHPLIWEVATYRLPCNCVHCYKDPHNNECPFTKWRRPRKVKMQVVCPRPEVAEALVGNTVAFEVETIQNTKAIHFGKVTQYDETKQLWLVKHDDKRLTDKEIKYAHLCIALQLYKTTQTSNMTIESVTESTPTANKTVVLSSDTQTFTKLTSGKVPKRKRLPMKTDNEIKQEYSLSLQSVISKLEKFHNKVDKLNVYETCALLWIRFQQYQRYSSKKKSAQDLKNMLKEAIKSNPLWNQNSDSGQHTQGNIFSQDC